MNPVHTLSPAPADVLLADGRVAVIRPLLPSDACALMGLHDGVADTSLRMRFFSVSRKAAHDYVDHLMQGTEDTVLSLLAVVQDRVLAQATAERTAPDTAEIAFLVADEARGQGLGSLLLEHLAAACRDRGVTTFVAEVLSENDAMLRVFLDAGFSTTRTSSDGVVELQISTAATSRAIRAADDRECRSEARSLQPLLYPQSVALIGVRREGGGIGNAVLGSILAGGFTGRLHLVHPTATEISGVPAYSSLTLVPEHVDVAVIAVPALRVIETLRDAAAAGASSAVVITSGFGELGPKGTALQKEILSLARQHGMRLVGPNCLGLLSNDPAIRLNATFTRAMPRAGGLAIASQSGGVGITMLDLAQDLGLGVHSFVSLGNKADVSGNDLLAAWYDDPNVTVAALYLESFGNAPKFARIARRFAQRKPLLAVVGGRSAGGGRGGASHTAAAAAPAVGVDALFAQAGVIACRSAESMAKAALFLTEQPLPRGSRVGIISNAGGIGVLAADAAEVLGLVVPELSVQLRAKLGKLVQGTAGTSNPIDLGAGADATHLTEVAGATLASDEVDALVVALVATNVTDPQPLVSALAQLRAGYPDIPVTLVAMGGLTLPESGVPGVTVYRSTDDALDALALAGRYADWLRLPSEEPSPGDDARASAAQATAHDALATARSQDGWLAADEVAELLSPYGLLPVGELADNPLAAADAAAQIGFPVAVKVADETVVHKTDRGLVRIGLRSAPEVIAAVRAFAKELDREDVPVLVQPVVTGVEIALGVVRDPGFGPLVMVAAGGIATGVWNDRIFLLPPVTPLDASRALRSLRIWPLLNGYRGSDRVDLDDLEHLICSLGQLASDVTEIAELDLNPVMATPKGAVLVDVKVRLAAGRRVDDGVPRQLRMPQ
ncbi:MAG TPA: GNAT family N-acetyltransferase [Nocardioidaceae bacterium]|nr:GNAT family N-acetyltransferase [Nocardioidaceae bacterium]